MLLMVYGVRDISWELRVFTARSYVQFPELIEELHASLSSETSDAKVMALEYRIP